MLAGRHGQVPARETQRCWVLYSTAVPGLASRASKWNTMDMGRPNIDISDLTMDERLALIEELWDSVAASPGELTFTDEQRTELDRRLDEMDRDDTLGVPWDAAINEIRDRK
jgi:putative addiction module component (TIGR02574 family)